MKEKMDADDKWIALLRSIFKAARILKIHITEKEAPSYKNWFVASQMNKRMWDLVVLKRKEA